jgi:hypothetical protein
MFLFGVGESARAHVRRTQMWASQNGFGGCPSLTRLRPFRRGTQFTDASATSQKHFNRNPLQRGRDYKGGRRVQESLSTAATRPDPHAASRRSERLRADRRYELTVEQRVAKSVPPVLPGADRASTLTTIACASDAHETRSARGACGLTCGADATGGIRAPHNSHADANRFQVL